MKDAPETSFLAQNEFLLRRLHSLSGIIPVGAYMCVHLSVNSLAFFSPRMYQLAVNQIHSLGPLLPIVEWAFIFLPLLFHAIYGVIIVRSGQPNSGSYKNQSNFRYTLQRATGMVALLFIFWHVFHMHGWIHTEGWLKTIDSLGGGQFKAYNAVSTASEAMRMSAMVWIIYAVGILSCVYHLANGMWTFGITWGLWVSPEAQDRALKACGAFGIVLAVIGMTAWTGFAFTIDTAKAKVEEDKIFKSAVSAGLIDEQEAAHKRAGHEGDHKPANVAGAADSTGS